MRLDIRIDERKVGQELRELSQAGQRAMIRTLNIVARSLRTEASKAIRETYAIRKSDVDKHIEIRLASPGIPAAIVRARGKRTPLFVFRARWSRSAAGATVQVKLSGGRKLIRHTFTATMKSGHQGVFERLKEDDTRAARLPIQEHYGPSIPQMAGSKAMTRRLEAFVDREIPKVFDREMKYYQSKV